MAYVASALAGLVGVGFASVLIAGELWPSMRYEDALPGLLAAAIVGATGAMFLVRIARRRR